MTAVRFIVGVRGRWKAARARRAAKKQAQAYWDSCRRAGIRLEPWRVEYIHRWIMTGDHLPRVDRLRRRTLRAHRGNDMTRAEIEQYLSDLAIPWPSTYTSDEEQG